MNARNLGVIMLCWLAGSIAAPAGAGTITYDFANSLEGWEAGWHKTSPGGSGTPGVVSWSNERGSGDSTSLKFDMGDGRGDDGTLWIARQFPSLAGLQTATSVSFDLYSSRASDANRFQVKAAIREDKPGEQSDFITIGETNVAAGWVPYSYSRSVSSQSGNIWVAVGIRVAWETHRDYWIDHVSVTNTSVPEPASMVLLAGGAAFLLVRCIGQALARRSRGCSSEG